MRAELASNAARNASLVGTVPVFVEDRKLYGRLV
jgi:hypothetical protein